MRKAHLSYRQVLGGIWVVASMATHSVDVNAQSVVDVKAPIVSESVGSGNNNGGTPTTIGIGTLATPSPKYILPTPAQKRAARLAATVICYTNPATSDRAKCTAAMQASILGFILANHPSINIPTTPDQLGVDVEAAIVSENVGSGNNKFGRTSTTIGMGTLAPPSPKYILPTPTQQKAARLAATVICYTTNPGTSDRAACIAGHEPILAFILANSSPSIKDITDIPTNPDQLGAAEDICSVIGDAKTPKRKSCRAVLAPLMPLRWIERQRQAATLQP